MDLSPYIASLREDLATAASAGDENTRRTAAALSAALEPAARLAIMNALSDLAAEVTASLDGQVVDVRLSGRDVQVVVTGSAEPEPEPAPRQEVPNFGAGDATGDISRITLHALKRRSSWIWEPASVEYFGSADGVKFVSLGSVTNHEEGAQQKIAFTAKVHGAYRYLKVIARNKGIIPAGNPGAGRNAWLFVDEIEVH